MWRSDKACYSSVAKRNLWIMRSGAKPVSTRETNATEGLPGTRDFGRRRKRSGKGWHTEGGGGPGSSQINDSRFWRKLCLLICCFPWSDFACLLLFAQLERSQPPRVGSCQPADPRLSLSITPSGEKRCASRQTQEKASSDSLQTRANALSPPRAAVRRVSG
jgi:hypothetical protein